MKKFLLILACTFLAAIIFTGCAEDSDNAKSDKNVQLIRNSAMDMYPEVPIGKAFDKFFSEGKWSPFSEGDSVIVEFVGRYKGINGKVPVKIQFTIADNKFELSYADMHGVAFDREERVLFLGTILDKYKPK